MEPHCCPLGEIKTRKEGAAVARQPKSSLHSFISPYLCQYCFLCLKSPSLSIHVALLLFPSTLCSNVAFRVRHSLTVSLKTAPNTHGQRSLVGCSLWGHKESDTTEQLSTQHNTLYLLVPYFSITLCRRCCCSVMSNSSRPHG